MATGGTSGDLLKLYPNKRKLLELFLGSTEMETVWKLFKAVYSITGSRLPLEKYALNKLLNNGKYTKGIIKFEEYCDVYFLKSENCRKPNQAKAVKTDAKSNQRRIGVGIMP